MFIAHVLNKGWWSLMAVGLKILFIYQRERSRSPLLFLCSMKVFIMKWWSVLFRMSSSLLIVFLSTTFPTESILTPITEPSAFNTTQSNLLACFIHKLPPQQTAAQSRTLSTTDWSNICSISLHMLRDLSFIKKSEASLLLFVLKDQPNLLSRCTAGYIGWH